MGSTSQFGVDLLAAQPGTGVFRKNFIAESRWEVGRILMAAATSDDHALPFIGYQIANELDRARRRRDADA